MSEKFLAWQIDKDGDRHSFEQTRIDETELMEGDVTVSVDYTTLNYKDGLAITGRMPIVRRYPLIPGIDFCGTVLESAHAGFKVGDAVILNGFGVGEGHHGGYAQKARVKGDWLVALPPGISSRQAMAIGTAGYTAMLCILALEGHGLRPGDGDLLVTGAAGGVGSIAVAVLNKLGYRVVAVTGRMQEKDFLIGLGAADVIERAPFAEKPRPLAKALWSAAIDVAGGNTLANVLSQVRPNGAVAICGNAESMSLPASVAPFILRGVTMYGIDSAMAPIARRQQAWQRLATDLDLDLLESLAFDLAFDDIPQAAEDIIAGKIRGRAVIKLPD